MPETIVKVSLPAMGESVTEGSIVEWRVKPGQWIDAGATLVDVTTDKVDVEVPAPASGVVTSLAAEEGATVAVGGVLAEIDTSAQKPDAASASPAAQAPATPKPATPPAAPASNGAAGGGRASHRAQRIAEREHLDLRTVRGSGPDGLILAGDVAKAATSWPEHAAKNGSVAALPPLPAPAADARVTPLRGPAASLAGYMEASLSIPTATSFRTLQVAALEDRRSEMNAALKAAGRTEKISFTHLIAFALVRAAREQPAIVTSFKREGATPAKVENGIHLGLAVDAQRKDGSRVLVVPVIKRADTLDFPSFRAAYDELVGKARDGKLVADELSGASFTLTNPGGIGTVASVPRLMPGQGAIIAAGAIGYPPGFGHTNDATLRQLGVEKVMTLTSTYDHRVIQGAQSGEYLKRVDELLQGSDRFYDEIFASLALTPKVRAESPARAAHAPVAVTEAPPVPPRELEPHSDEMLAAVAAGMAIISAYRRHGHLNAMLDPLGTRPAGDPALDWHTYGLTPAIMHAIPASIFHTRLRGNTLADIVAELSRTYSSTIAYEIEHIANIEQRVWLRDYIETGTHVAPLSPEQARDVLARLTRVESLERYMRKTYIGQKTFSIEGLDMMIPMLEDTITQLAEDGVETAVIGMAHRGRLSTIACVVNRPLEEIFVEFDAAAGKGAGGGDDVTGDVKYHHGATGTYHTPD
ncbi:MAG TPA: 2-oxo acid dehydrogenase subunit E2, partial [Candidatus Baltobacteraceae bacterium]|nr:2-oxo acid dehydrogenase subunit E2 [Candidatus Baltobacteraceae bacterium]